MSVPHRWVIDVLARDGRSLGRSVVTPDWAAALAWVRFEGIRAGCLPPVTTAVPGGVEPVWDGDAGQPFVAALRVVVGTGDAGIVSREIPIRYLQPAAEQVATRLVVGGASELQYVVTAFPDTGTGPPDPPTPGLEVEEVAAPLPLGSVPLASLSEGATLVGPEDADGRLPVLVPRGVLAEARDLARATPDVESGGVLVGRLHRDPGGGEVFLEVTAQVPAVDAQAGPMSLTFTPETWAAVRAAIRLRAREEVVAGWWHHHPDFCRLRGCPPERRAGCPAADPFLSAADRHLHAVCFGAAYHLALLVSDSTARGITWTLYGWHQGMVTPRGFHLLGGRRDATYATHGS